MTAQESPKYGLIGWFDLTVPNADEVRDFYASVVGWEYSAVDMKGYSDYCMNLPDSDETVAGICHRRNLNSTMPPQWLMYITVENLDRSIERAVALGGKVVVPTRGSEGQGKFCVIQDPAGAVVALYEAGKK